jgi:hypothetical protein
MFMAPWYKFNPGPNLKSKALMPVYNWFWISIDYVVASLVRLPKLDDTMLVNKFVVYPRLAYKIVLWEPESCVPGMNNWFNFKLSSSYSIQLCLSILPTLTVDHPYPVSF